MDNKIHRHFFVTGLPRCRTAWFANYLTTDRSLCYHTGHVFLGKDYEKGLLNDSYYYTGDSSFTIGVSSVYRTYPSSPVLVIHRPIQVVMDFFYSVFQNALDETKLKAMLHLIEEANNQIPDALHVNYDDINGRIKEIWHHLLPDLPYQKDRTTLLLPMNIQVNEFDDFLAAIRLTENL